MLHIREYPFQITINGIPVINIPIYVGFQDSYLEFDFLTWSRRNDVPIELHRIVYKKAYKKLGSLIYRIDPISLPISYRVKDTHVDYIYNYDNLSIANRE